jgi:hypothetical protein
MNERASWARQRRGPGSLHNRGAFSRGAGAERATDDRCPCVIAERFRGAHVRLCGEVVG